LSEGHPGYSPDATLEKLDHIVGPHTCEVFERNNAAGCTACPHKGKIKSPIVLGREVPPQPEDTETDAEAEVADDATGGVVHRVPPYPEPFFRGATGGIFRRPESDEAPPTFVYEHDIYVVKRMRDPGLGEVVVMRLHLPRDGVHEFVVPNARIADRAELRKALASQGVVCGDKRFGYILELIQVSIRELQFKKRAELMRTQFGWADNDGKFIIGDREITVDGVFQSPHTTTGSSRSRMRVHSC
jgi:hypothetical protein